MLEQYVPFFIMIGHQVTPATIFPVFEDNYIKFMSENGVEDNAQGRAFRQWLNLTGQPFVQLTPRSFNVSNEIVRILNLVTGHDPDDDDVDPPTEDIRVERHSINGSLVLSCLVGGHLRSKSYYQYAEEEARELFREEFLK